MQQNNVDPAEIAKFSRLASDWWNPFGTSAPLHHINPLRLEFIQKHCVLAQVPILDVGCGGGILSESLGKSGAKVVGIDMCEEAIAVARHHANEQGLPITYIETLAEDFALDHADQFDILTCMELLEHVPDPASLIAACARLLKPGGHAFFSTINRNLKAYVQAIIGAEFLLKLLPKGTHDYQRFIRPVEMFESLQAQGLRLVDMAGMHYNPITKTYRLTDDVSVNYLMYCCKQ